MKVLFLSQKGELLSIANRVLFEGHRPFLYINHPNAREIGDGIVEKPSYPAALTYKGRCDKGGLKLILEEVNPDLVVIGGEGFGEAGDITREKGIPTFGGGLWADIVEREENYALKMLSTTSLLPPPPEGISSRIVNVGVGAWWNGLTPLSFYALVERHFMNKKVGPDVECAGALVAVPLQNSRLIREGFGEVESLLKKTSFRGFFYLDLLVSRRNLFVVRVLPRLVFDTVQPFFELYKGRLTDLFLHVANGSELKGGHRSEYATSVRVSIPPYPYGLSYNSQIPIKGVVKENKNHIWLRDVKNGEEGLEAGRFDGNLLTVTARGTTVREAGRRVYRNISFLSIPNAQYRTDIGDRLRTHEVVDEWRHQNVKVVGEVNLLQEWGWI